MTYRLEGVFTAIADANRRQLLDYLRDGEMTAGQLAKRFDMSRPAVARHLKILERTGLVQVERSGKYRIYRISPGPLSVVREWLAKYDGFWEDRLAALQHQVEAEMLGEAAHTPESQPDERPHSQVPSD